MILKNKEIAVELLQKLTGLNIQAIEFEDLKNMNVSSGYDFSVIKLKATIEKQLHNETEIYIKMIRKDRIKESIFCYWSLVYEENFKNYEESEFTSVINKVKITETESNDYKHSVLLEIKGNKWGILEYGSTIHLVKLEKYLNDKTIKKSKLINEWKKYVEEGNEDVLFIGVVNKSKPEIPICDNK